MKSKDTKLMSRVTFLDISFLIFVLTILLSYKIRDTLNDNAFYSFRYYLHRIELWNYLFLFVSLMTLLFSAVRALGTDKNVRLRAAIYLVIAGLIVYLIYRSINI